MHAAGVREGFVEVRVCSSNVKGLFLGAQQAAANFGHEIVSFGEQRTKIETLLDVSARSHILGHEIHLQNRPRFRKKWKTNARHEGFLVTFVEKFINRHTFIISS